MTNLGRQDLLTRDSVDALFRCRHFRTRFTEKAPDRQCSPSHPATRTREPIRLGPGPAQPKRDRPTRPRSSSRPNLQPSPAWFPTFPPFSTHILHPMSAILLAIGQGLALFVGGFATIVLLNVVYQVVSLACLCRCLPAPRPGRARFAPTNNPTDSDQAALASGQLPDTVLTHPFDRSSLLRATLRTLPRCFTTCPGLGRPSRTESIRWASSRVAGRG